MPCQCGVYRNRFECREANRLGPEWAYEPIRLPYVIAATYTPDFVCHETKTIRETKGHFPAEDRRKMLAVRAANPEWRIILVFQRPNTKISKGSKTTYAMWAERNGFEWEPAPRS